MASRGARPAQARVAAAALTLALAVAACDGGSDPGAGLDTGTAPGAAGGTSAAVVEPDAEPVAFTAVALADGAAPVVLAADGDDLLIGAHRAGAAVVPGLTRRAADGTLTEIPTTAASPYGLLATWRSISTDGSRLFALGGERGGAHGHVRWSVWTGLADGPGAGLTERVQGFSVFGGYEAGDLVGGVLTQAGPVVAGAWASADTGFDVAVWTTADEVDWARQPSAGTALASTATTLGFPMNVTRAGDGLLVAGWQIALDDGARQLPVVWTSDGAPGSGGPVGWTATRLPDAGAIGTALAAGCWDGGCAVVGRVDGVLAVWERRDGGEWRRVTGAPAIPVGDVEQLAAPIDVDGALTIAIADGDRVVLARADGDTWTVREARGPGGAVAAVARAGDGLFVVAGTSDADRVLWRADVTSLG